MPHIDPNQSRDIETLYEVYKSFDKNKDAVKDGKITNLFFVHTKHGLEFVKKNSFYGKWLSLVNWIQQKMGKDPHTFDIDKNLKDVSKIFKSAVTDIDIDTLEEIASVLCIEETATKTAGRVLQEDLSILFLELNQLEERVTRSRREKQPERVGTPRVLTEIKLPDFAKKTDAFYEAVKLKESIKAAFPDMSKAERSSLISVLIASGDQKLIASDIEKGGRDLLISALRKSLTAQISPFDRANIRSILQELAPLTPDAGTTFKLERANLLTAACSSSFARESSQEKDTVASHLELMLQFLPEDSPHRPLIANAIAITSDAPIPKERVKSAEHCLLYTENRVFEVKKETATTYTVRIYSEGSKLPLPTELQPKAMKQQGYVEIAHVSEDELFGSTSLVQRALQLLGKSKGPKALMDHFLKPDRAGTTASRSLTAAIANQLDEPAALQFKLDYDLYILDNLAKQLQCKVSQPIDNKEYQELNQLHTQAVRAMDEFRIRLEGLSPEERQRATHKQLLLVDLLDRLDARLVVSEKELYTQALSAMNDPATVLEVQGPKDAKRAPPDVETREAKAATPTPLTDAETRLLATISSIPASNNANFSTEVTRSLALLGQADPTSVSYQYALDAFCKKVGSFAALQQIEFTDPKQALDNFEKVFKALTTNLSHTSLEKSRPEQYAMALFFAAGMQASYRKFGNKERVLPDSFTSFLASPEIQKQVTALRTQDPFWADRFREIASIATKEELLFDVPLHTNKASCRLGQEVIQAIKNWVDASEIPASIASDRKEQRAKIASEIALEEKKKQGFEKEKATQVAKKLPLEKTQREEVAKKTALDSEIAKDKAEVARLEKLPSTPQLGVSAVRSRTLHEESPDVKRGQILAALLKKNKELSSLNDSIAFRERELAEITDTIKKLDESIKKSQGEIDFGIKDRIKSDPQYWPWGIDTHDDPPPGLWTDKQKTAYFCINTKIPVPAEFTHFLENYAVTTNLFNKTEGSVPKFEFSIAKLPSDTLQLTCKDAPFQETSIRPDRYTEALAKGPYTDVYNDLYKTHYISETEIPHAVSGAEQRGLLARLKFWDRGQSLNDEQRELYQLHAAKEIQIDSTISYFQEHPKMLYSSDGRTLFHALMFESDLLLSELEDPKSRPLIINRLGTLFHDVISSSIQLGDLETATNMLWLAASVQSYINATPGPKDPVLNIDDLFALTTRCASAANQNSWPELFETVLAASGRALELDPANEKLFVYALLARTIKNTPRVAGEKRPGLYEQDVERAELILKEKLSNTKLEDMTRMLNMHAPKLLETMYPALTPVALSPTNQQHVYTTKDKKTILSLTDGMITSSDPTIYRQFSSVLTTETKKLLVETNVYPSETDTELLRCYKEGTITCILDTKRNLLLKVDEKTKDVFIKKEPLGWVQHLSPSKKIAISTVANASYTQWYDVDKDTLYLVDPKTFEPVFVRDSSNEIRDIATKRLLVKLPEDFLFDSFEPLACTYAFANPNSKIVQEIQFPRLNLSFEKVGDKWVLKSAKEWQIATEQFVSHLEQKTGFLLLENSKTGEKKALFPYRDLDVRDDTVLFTPDSRNTSSRFVECKVTDSALIPQSNEARYLLAHLFLAKNRLDQAEKLLYAALAEASTKKLTVDERNLLKKIALSPLANSSNPRALRCQMHALSIMKRNDAQFPPQVMNEAKQELPLVLKYLEHVPPTQRLEAERELAVLKSIENETTDKEIKERVIILREIIEGQKEATKTPILQTKEKAVSLPPVQDPRARQRYDAFRLDNTFPFNPQNLSLDEFRTFLPMLETECSALSIEQAKANGMLALLEYLSQFGKTNFIKATATDLQRKFLTPVTGEQIHKDLLQLSLIQAPSPLRTFGQEYFVKQSARNEKVALDTAFAANSAEIEAGDAMTKQVFKNVSEDIARAKDLLTDTAYTLQKDKDITTLKDELETTLDLALKSLAHKETIIVNAVAQSLSLDPKDFATGKAKAPTIDELCLLCARKNYDTFAKTHYPHLSPEGRKNLQAAVKSYLFHKETVQQLKRSLQLADTILDAKSAGYADMVEQLQNKLAMTLDATRAYYPDHKFAMIFLLLETTLDLKLRTDQVKNILEFDANKRNGEECVLQMIMGAGKSSIIQPFLALLFAEEDTFSCIMAPEAQLETVRTNLVNTLGSAYDSCVFTLNYDQELSQDLGYLDTFLARCKEAKEKGACFLTSPRTKHSLLTSLYEAYYKSTLEPESKQAESRAEKISAICDFLQVYEWDQIDEIDLIMNPKVVFKRPVGEKKVFDKDTNFERSKILSDLVLYVAETDDFDISIDFRNAFRGKKSGPDINEKLYDSIIKPKLVEKAFELLSQKNPRLKQFIDENKEYTTYFLTQSADDPDALQKAREWIAKADLEQSDKDLIGSCAHAISNILPTSLLHECNSQYGKDENPNKLVARPYEAPDKPKPTMYADPHEKIIYSVQLTLKNGLSSDKAKKLLIEWQALAKKEMKQKAQSVTSTAWYQRFNDILNKAGGPALEFLTDPKSPQFEEVVAGFQEAVKHDRQTLLEFFQKNLYEEVTLYTKDVTSTPQTLVGSSQKSFGYTGTMHTGILASSMKGIPELGTDGKTITRVEEKIIKGEAEVIYNSEDQPGLVINSFKDKDFFVFIDSGGFLKDEKMQDFAKKALDECGRPDIEGIVFHNQDGKIVCLERDGTITPFEYSHLKNKPEARLTIIAQQYETGTNIQQTSTAKALVSIRKDMTLRDALQSYFRMRSILEGQSVSPVLSDEVKNHISAALLDSLQSHEEIGSLFSQVGPIDILSCTEKLKALHVPHDVQTAFLNALRTYNSDGCTMVNAAERQVALLNAFCKEYTPDSPALWRYLTVNQAKDQRDKNWQAARYRMRETLEKPVRALLTDKAIPFTERRELFHAMESFFVHTESDSPFKMLCTGVKEVDAQVAIDREVSRMLEAFDTAKKTKLFTKLCEKISKDTPANARNALKDKLTNCVSISDISEKIKMLDTAGEIQAEREDEVQTQQDRGGTEREEEAERQTERERDIQVSKIPPPLAMTYRELVQPVREGSRAYDTSKFFDTKFESFANLVPSELEFSHAKSVEYSRNLFLAESRLDKVAHARYHLAARYVLALHDGTTPRYILVSHEDAARIKLGMKETRLTGQKRAVLCTLNGSVVAQSSPNSLSAFPSLPEVLLESKFCTAKGEFSSNEVQKLDALIKKSVEPAKFRKACRNFYEGCTEYLKTVAEDYNNSALQEMLHK